MSKPKSLHSPNPLKAYFVWRASVAGQATSAKKAEACRRNGAMPCAPGKKRGRPPRAKKA